MKDIEFEWDENKREINLKKHGLDFCRAIDVFLEPMVTQKILRNDEVRYKSIGVLRHNGIKIGVSVIHTPRKDNIRIISFRRARREEEKLYDEKFN